MRLVGLLVLMLVSLGSSSGPQCVIFNKPEDLWAVSDLVFLGTVITTKHTGNEGFHVVRDIATLRVEKTWKGEPGKEIDIAGDAFFEKDKQYLVFAGGKPPGTSLECRGTELAERAKAKLDWLAKRKP